MKQKFSPKELARIIDASEASIKRWCDKGVLATERTPGGHRKIHVSSVLALIKENHVPVKDPALLGLPYSPGVSGLSMQDAQYCFETALEEGNEQLARYVVFDLYMNGTPPAVICDDVIAVSYHNLGDKWQHDIIEIYQERRAVQLTHRIINALREALPPAPAHASRAIGATLKGDPYSLPGMMIECCLSAMSWNAVFYGGEHPTDTLCSAIAIEQPRLFWLSVSTIANEQAFIQSLRKIYHTAADLNVLLALGGRAITPELRKKIDYTIFCDTVKELTSFAKALDQ